MSDMLKVFVGQELKEQIKSSYSHMENPPCMYAKVFDIKRQGEKFSCTLKLLDKNKQVDSTYPTVPGVLTNIAFEVNDIAVILLPYGRYNPYIVGKL